MERRPSDRWFAAGKYWFNGKKMARAEGAADEECQRVDTFILEDGTKYPVPADMDDARIEYFVRSLVWGDVDASFVDSLLVRAGRQRDRSRGYPGVQLEGHRGLRRHWQVYLEKRSGKQSTTSCARRFSIRRRRTNAILLRTDHMAQQS
jgi:hypothetical protein